MPLAAQPKEGSRFVHLLHATEQLRHKHKKWVQDPVEMPSLGRTPTDHATDAEVRQAQLIIQEHVAQHFSPKDIQRICIERFQCIDLDHSGRVSQVELEHALSMCNLPLAKEALERVIADRRHRNGRRTGELHIIS